MNTRIEEETEKLKSRLLDSNEQFVDVSGTDEEESTQLKLTINELVWRYAGDSTTLKQAEEIASNFWSAIMQTRG